MKKVIMLMLLISSLSFGKLVNNAWDGGVFQVKDVIKSMVKDPDSVKYYNWYKVGIIEGTQVVRCDFGARNSYGGMVRMDCFFLFDMNDNFIMYVENK